VENKGKFQIINPFNRGAVAGERFNLSAQEVIEFCACYGRERLAGWNATMELYHFTYLDRLVGPRAYEALCKALEEDAALCKALDEGATVRITAVDPSMADPGSIMKAGLVPQETCWRDWIELGLGLDPKPAVWLTSNPTPQVMFHDETGAVPMHKLFRITVVLPQSRKLRPLGPLYDWLFARGKVASKDQHGMHEVDNCWMHFGRVPLSRFRAIEPVERVHA
jgi:hypothetical protein